MSINNPDTALKYILQTNTAITALLGVYQGTTIPLIAGDSLPEVEMGKSALVYYLNSIDPNRNIEDSEFTINCYAQDTSDLIKDARSKSLKIARTIVKELNGGQSFANGYPITTTCRIQRPVPDPTIKEVNTPVEIRLYNINGGA